MHNANVLSVAPQTSCRESFFTFSPRVTSRCSPRWCRQHGRANVTARHSPRGSQPAGGDKAGLFKAVPQQVAALGDPAAAEGSPGQATSQIPWQSLRFGAAARSPARPLRIAVERAQTTLQTKKKNQCHEEYTLNYCSLKPFQYQHHLLSIILLLTQERRSIA